MVLNTDFKYIVTKLGYNFEMQTPILNRIKAGQLLSERLVPLNIANPIVLALPRGGVPVAYEIATALHAPLDLLIVRKLGTPSYPELAMGAIASGNIKVLNQHVIQAYGITDEAIAKVEFDERAELNRREHAYRGNHPNPSIKGRNVIIVDDGLATGSTMFAAVEALKQQHPNSITVAITVAPAEQITELVRKVDKVVCPLQPDDFSSVGEWYQDFSQVSDEQVKRLLEKAWKASS